MGEVSTVSTTIGSTTQSTIPTGGPTTTTTEPVFTSTTKDDTTTTTLEDNVTTTTTTTGPTEITTTTERDSTDVGADTTEGEDGTTPTITENAEVTEFVTDPSTDSTNIAHDGNDDNDGVEDDEPEHPTIGWPTKNQNLQVKKIVREFEKILSGFRGKLDDDFIDRWTGENGGIGKFKNNADRIMRSITSSDRDCIDLETKISNPFKQESSFKIVGIPFG